MNWSKNSILKSSLPHVHIDILKTLCTLYLHLFIIFLEMSKRLLAHGPKVLTRLDLGSQGEKSEAQEFSSVIAENKGVKRRCRCHKLNTEVYETRKVA